MENGSLFDLFEESWVDWTWALRRSMALDCSSGMAYLHSAQPPILHLDLKSLNILVDEKKRAKVSDFGLSKLKTGKEAVSDKGSPLIGSLLWVEPSVFNGEAPSESSDVFSFGILLSEIVNLSLPYPQQRKQQMQPVAIAYQVANGCADGSGPLRPQLIAPDCPAAMANLCGQCWAASRDDRPTFPAITRALKDMSF